MSITAPNIAKADQAKMHAGIQGGIGMLLTDKLYLDINNFDPIVRIGDIGLHIDSETLKYPYGKEGEFNLINFFKDLGNLDFSNYDWMELGGLKLETLVRETPEVKELAKWLGSFQEDKVLKEIKLLGVPLFYLKSAANEIFNDVLDIKQGSNNYSVSKSIKLEAKLQGDYRLEFSISNKNNRFLFNWEGSHGLNVCLDAYISAQINFQRSTTLENLLNQIPALNFKQVLAIATLNPFIIPETKSILQIPIMEGNYSLNGGMDLFFHSNSSTMFMMGVEKVNTSRFYAGIVFGNTVVRKISNSINLNLNTKFEPYEFLLKIKTKQDYIQRESKFNLPFITIAYGNKLWTEGSFGILSEEIWERLWTLSNDFSYNVRLDKINNKIPTRDFNENDIVNLFDKKTFALFFAGGIKIDRAHLYGIFSNFPLFSQGVGTSITYSPVYLDTNVMHRMYGKSQTIINSQAWIRVGQKSEDNKLFENYFINIPKITYGFIPAKGERIIANKFDLFKSLEGLYFSIAGQHILENRYDLNYIPHIVLPDSIDNKYIGTQVMYGWRDGFVALEYKFGDLEHQILTSIGHKSFALQLGYKFRVGEEYKHSLSGALIFELKKAQFSLSASLKEARASFKMPF